MGTKHDVLTEEEMASYNVNPKVIEQLETLLRSLPCKKPAEINILDWGCGRGRSVAKLREKGFNAFGVDVDLKTMANGFSLFEQRGLTPNGLLRPVNEVSSFDDGFFHLIFSEQVFEHVEDLAGIVSELARLTAPGGIGVHCFPGSRNVWEDHLHMPFVHWLPKALIRKYWISMMLLLGYGPNTPWPEAKGRSFWETADLYYCYMNEKTYYRDSEEINEEFNKRGFIARYDVNGSRLGPLIPRGLHRNGFPRGGVVFVVKRHKDAKRQSVETDRSNQVGL